MFIIKNNFTIKNILHNINYNTIILLREEKDVVNGIKRHFICYSIKRSHLVLINKNLQI